jgi:predicted DNA-binding protein YlxM (UPF0122 family)
MAITTWPSFESLFPYCPACQTEFEAKTMTTLRQEISAIIETIKRKKQLFDDLLESLGNTLDKLDELPPDMAEMILEPMRQRVAEVTSPSTTSFARTVRARKHTQFARICHLFIQNDNDLMSIQDIAREINTSKSAVANIIYRTQRGAFISERAPGHRRLRLWKLQSQVYREILEQHNDDDDA